MRKAQLSYEYIVIVGSILVLLLPFFYKFMGGVATLINEYYAGESVNLLAQSTKTVANLGSNNKVTLPLRIQAVIETEIENNLISFRLPSGHISAAGASCVGASPGALQGTGTFFTQVTAYDLLIAIGDGPIISHVVPEGVTPQRDRCFQPSEINTNQEFIVYGANFQENSQIVVTNINTQSRVIQNGELQDNYPGEADALGSSQPVLGVGEYTFEVLNSDGISNKLIVSVTPPGKGGGSDK